MSEAEKEKAIVERLKSWERHGTMLFRNVLTPESIAVEARPYGARKIEIMRGGQIVFSAELCESDAMALAQSLGAGS